jgi:DNA-binding response OmpR family regulator/EAL domain-containing protein (putative c-di-GMP-specific phosphodiesterase class I)
MTANAPASHESGTPRPTALGEIEQLWSELEDRWAQDSAEQLAELVDRGFETAHGDLMTRLGDLAAYLASFVETGKEPNTAQRIRLAELVSQLSAAPAEPTPPATASATPAAPAPVPVTAASDAAAAPSNVAQIEDAVAAASRQRTARNTLCLLAVGDKLAPGLHAALSERGYDLQHFGDAIGLRDFLARKVPGAVIMTAPQLRALPALAARWRDAPAPPAVVVLSPDRDLTHRLLALRSGAAAFFPAPIDSYRIAARVDELLGRQDTPPYRVLLVEQDRDLAIQCGQWIAAEGMTARVAAHGAAAISALADFQPDAVLIDAQLPDARGIDVVQMIRQQAEYATLPIVLAAEAGDATERFDAIAAGADEVLAKPLKPRHVVGVIRSRVQRAQWLRAQAEASAARDPKTGLYPRSLVIERIASRIGTQGSALLMVQFDDVDALRAAVGLTALAAIDVEMGTRLRELLANHDLPCGLRDFAWLVLLTRERREQLTQLAERIRFAIVERPLAVAGATFEVTASIGLVALDEVPIEADAAVAAAERACADAQGRGGNMAAWSSLDDTPQADPVLAVRAVLSRPLDPRNLRVEYRPLVPLRGSLHDQFDFEFYLGSAASGGSRGSYALCARIADELGVRAALERARFEIAFNAREEARGDRHALRLTMPVTANWLLDRTEMDWLLETLASRQLAAGGFTFELCGAELLDHRSELDAPIARLREAGVRFGLGDFGRDFAAVHVLTQLPIDVLRLDHELLEATASANSTSPTLIALVRKAHQLGAAVIAPAMNTLEHAHIYTRLGIDYGVGNAFGPALTQPDFDFNRPLW